MIHVFETNGGNYVGSFKSGAEFSEKFGINRGNVYRGLTGQRATVNKYLLLGTPSQLSDDQKKAIRAIIRNWRPPSLWDVAMNALKVN